MASFLTTEQFYSRTKNKNSVSKKLTKNNFKIYKNIRGKCRILSNFEGSEKLDLKYLIAKIDIKLDLSRFAFNFNAENL
jgi:hypothetical protein